MCFLPAAFTGERGFRLLKVELIEDFETLKDLRGADAPRILNDDVFGRFRHRRMSNDRNE